MIFNNVNYPNNLLQNAIERGDLSAVKRALIRGADVNATIRHFYNEKRTVSEYVEDSPTPAAGQLWLLADDRFYRIAADGTSTIALGSYIAKPAPRVETVVFKSPLTLAASLNALEIANFLYDNGAIVKDDSLRLAIQNNYVFMAQFLVARIPLGANWSLSPNAAQNADCLAIALTRGWSEIVGALCLAGVGVNGHNLDRKSSLEIAAARGDLSMVHFLCNQKEKCEHRFSACVEAAKLGHRDMVAYLLSKRVNLFDIKIEQAHPSLQRPLQALKSKLQAAPNFFCDTLEESIPEVIAQAYLNAATESQGIMDSLYRIVEKKLDLNQPFTISFPRYKSIFLTLTRDPRHQRVYSSKVIAGELVYLANYFGFDESKIGERAAPAIRGVDNPGNKSDGAVGTAIPSGLPPSADISLSFPEPQGSTSTVASVVQFSASASAAAALSVSSLPHASAAGAGARPSVSSLIPPRADHVQMDERRSFSYLGPPLWSSRPQPVSLRRRELRDVEPRLVVRPENLLTPPAGSTISHFKESSAFDAVRNEDL